MGDRILERVPRTMREVEQFYRDVINKLKGTTTTLADEEKRSIAPIVGMVSDTNKRLESLARDNRNLRLDIDSLKRVEHDNKILRADIDSLRRVEQDNRLMRAQIALLIKRIDNLERS